MLAHEQKLTETSMYLRRVAPKEWDEFALALNEYTTQLMINMVKAPNGTLVQEQGRAQCAADICKILRDAPKTMEKLEAQRAMNAGMQKVQI